MKKSKKILILFFLIASAALPKFVLAASLYFSIIPAEIRQNDVFVAEVKISSPQEKINVADCVLFFNKDILDVKGISTGDSIFSLWTRSPIFSNDTGRIIFTGGAPTGFQGQEGEILKIVFLAKEKGKANLAFAGDCALYLNDGKGTKIQPKTNPLTISVLESSQKETPKDEWQGILATDKTPPSDPEIKLGRDPSMFDNKFFISFFATDEGSGIKFYEVKEGEGDFVRSESPYVLKDQSLKSPIFVKAIDKAGNEKIVQLKPELVKKPFYLNLWFISILVALILVRVLMWFLTKKACKKQNTIDLKR